MQQCIAQILDSWDVDGARVRCGWLRLAAMASCPRPQDAKPDPTLLTLQAPCCNGKGKEATQDEGQGGVDGAAAQQVGWQAAHKPSLRTADRTQLWFSAINHAPAAPWTSSRASAQSASWRRLAPIATERRTAIPQRQRRRNECQDRVGACI